LWRKAAKWFVGEIPFGKEVEKVHGSGNSFLNIKANIPTFQYSIIPLFQVWVENDRPQQSFLILVSYRYPETGSEVSWRLSPEHLPRSDPI
jgi:hypothetical protein